jgi:hypothetical protein
MAPIMLSQRQHPRKRVALRARTQLGVQPDHLAVVTDLSQGGAFIETRHPPMRGSRLWLSVPLADGNELNSYVEVTRVTNRGVGARFVRLDPDAAQLIAAV